MAITTLTVNGVDIETTASVTEVLAALQPTHTAPKVLQAETARRAAAKQAVAKPKAPKVRQARQPKAASSGKALWAELQRLVAEGQHDEARRLASVKPDTFGVQVERSIERHLAREAKPGTTKVARAPKVKVLPEGKQTRRARAAYNQPKAAERHPVLAEVVPEPPKAVKRAAKQAAAKQAAKRPTHKPDCGCVTCPEGVAKRQAAAAAKAPKVAVQAQPKAVAPKPKAAQPKAVEVTVQPKAVEGVKPEAITTEAYNNACDMMAKGDVNGLQAAAKACKAQAARQDRIGNKAVGEAYAEAADTYTTAAQMAADKVTA